MTLPFPSEVCPFNDLPIFIGNIDGFSITAALVVEESYVRIHWISREDSERGSGKLKEFVSSLLESYKTVEFVEIVNPRLLPFLQRNFEGEVVDGNNFLIYGDKKK